jgi:hypothetical protein
MFLGDDGACVEVCPSEKPVIEDGKCVSCSVIGCA